MDRRAFLAGSTGGIAAAALILPLRAGAVDGAARVFRLDRPAGLWRPFDAGLAAGAGPGVQRLRLLGPQLAAQSGLQALALYYNTPESKEGVQAFLEKRKPQYAKRDS